MSNITFTEQAWEEYCYWQAQDKKNKNNKENKKSRYRGLKNDLSGYWSRRIDEVNRLVYKIEKNHIEIIQCKGHYE